MNVCFVNNDYKIGGVQRVNFFLGESLRKRGHNVDYFSFFSDEQTIGIPSNHFYFTKNDFFLKTPFFKYLKKGLKGLEYYLFKSYSFPKYYYIEILELIRFINENNIDIAIMNQGQMISFIPLLKKKCPNTRFIAWVHSSYDVYINNYYKLFVKSFILGITAADSVICLSNEDQQSFKKLNFKTIQINNPVILSTEKHSDLNKKVISYVSRLSYFSKGIDRLIYLAKSLPDDWQIRIAGSGEQTEIDKIKESIAKEKVQEKIRLVGEITGEKLEQHYVQSSIFVSTSRWEGFGLVIVEAMKCGLPIISFENTGPKMILDDGKYGILIKQDNLEGLVCKVKELIESSVLRKEYGKLSLERVKEYDISKIATEWETILMTLKK